MITSRWGELGGRGSSVVKENNLFYSRDWGGNAGGDRSRGGNTPGERKNALTLNGRIVVRKAKEARLQERGMKGCYTPVQIPIRVFCDSRKRGPEFDHGRYM